MSAIPPHAGRTRGQRVLLTGGVALTVVLFAAAGVVLYARDIFADIEKLDVSLSPSTWTEAQNFLVVGSDSRDVIDPDDPNAAAFLGDHSAGQRADSIFIARIYPDGDRIDVLAFPRDLWLELAAPREPGASGPPQASGEQGRINGTYNDGAQRVVDTITLNFGIEIHHYVEMDFRGFEELVDILGGVPMYFENAVRDENSGLSIPEPGCISLNGPAALAYTRSRHLEIATATEWVTDPTGDLGRITRQQEFLRAALARAVDLDVTDVFKMNELARAANDHVKIDQGLAIGDLVELASRAEGFAAGAFNTYQIPSEGFRTSGGASVVRALDEPAAPILAIFRGEDATTSTTVADRAAPSPAEIAITVLNGSGVDGQASDAADAFEAMGFVVGEVGNTTLPSSRTKVWYGPEGAAAADVVAGFIQSGAQLVATDDLESNEIVVITGSDLGTITAPIGPTEPAEPQPSATTTPSSTTSTTVSPGLVPAVSPSDFRACG